MKLKLILNPAAGKGSSKKAAAKVEEILRQKGIDYSLDTTHKPGEATKLARKANQEGYEVVAAIGGDGTVNEVINGLIFTETALGVIPCGRGNDFAKFIGASHKIEEAVDLILNGQPKKTDAGRMNDRYFINGVGVGFDSRVALEVYKAPKFLTGIWNYLYAVLQTMFKFEPPHFTIRLENSSSFGEKFMVTVANGRYFGGGFMITPEAKPDDGLLDICVVENLDKLKILRYIPKVIRGTHTHLKEVLMLKAAEVKIEIKKPHVAHIDGELMEDSVFRIKVLPGAVRVIGR